MIRRPPRSTPFPTRRSSDLKETPSDFMRIAYEEMLKSVQDMTDKDEVELANAINVILPKYVKQEKLLELYKELATVRDDMLDACKIVDDDYYVIRETETNLKQKIKEIENEINL